MIKSIGKQDTDFKQATNTDIINHVLKNHHAFLKEELPEIERLIFTIFKVHFVDSGDVLERVHRLFSELKAEFQAHMIKEERVLFHLIKDYDNNPSKELLEHIMEGVLSLEENNITIENILKRLRKVTDNYIVPSTGCPTYEKAYNKLQEIESDTLFHFNLENDLMFKRLKDS